MKLVYPAWFYPCEEIENGYTVTFPDLPGCVTQGDNLPNAIEMAVDAASGWLLDEMEDNRELPVASKHTEISLGSKNGFINLIVLDMESYAEKYGNKAVRKNLTIPAWLNTIAEREQINFSSVLQNALMEQLHLAQYSR